MALEQKTIQILIFAWSMPILALYILLLSKAKRPVLMLLKILIFLIVPIITFYIVIMIKMFNGILFYNPDIPQSNSLLYIIFSSSFNALCYAVFIMPWIFNYKQDNNKKLLVTLSAVTIVMLAFFFPFVSKIAASKVMDLISKADFEEKEIPERPQNLEIVRRPQEFFYTGKMGQDKIWVNPCDDLCQRLLLSGEATKVAMTKFKTKHYRISVVYHIEKRYPCDMAFDGYSSHTADKRYIADDVERALTTSGLCIIPTIDGFIPDAIGVSVSDVNWREFEQSKIQKEYFSILKANGILYELEALGYVEIDYLSDENRKRMLLKSIPTVSYYSVPFSFNILGNAYDFKFFHKEKMTMTYQPQGNLAGSSVSAPDSYMFDIKCILKEKLKYSLPADNELVMRAEELAKTFPD